MSVDLHELNVCADLAKRVFKFIYVVLKTNGGATKDM